MPVGRELCPARTPWEPWCPAGTRALAGRDHSDQWYRDGKLVAIVHYPYGMNHDSLRDATAGCAELGLQVDIDAQWAIHACDQWTLGVVISRTGLHDVLHPGTGKRSDA